MELHHSSTDENDNLSLKYRCSCGYQDGKIIEHGEPKASESLDDVVDKVTSKNKYDKSY
jgi:hypothetical protein